MTTSKPIKPDVLSPEYWDAVGRENYLAARVKMVDVIRRELLGMIENSKGYLSETADTLKAWASEDATPEGLGDWLTREGWAKLDAAAIEAALVEDAQAALKKSNAHLAALETERVKFEDPEGNPLPPPAPYPVPDHYWTSSRKDEKTLVRYVWSMTAAAGKDNPLALPPPKTPGLYAHAVEGKGWPLDPVDALELYGIDALKDCFAGHAWGPPADLATERPGGWMRLILKGWLEYRHARELESLKRKATARDLAQAPAVQIGKSRYGRLPKVAAGMSWALGGPFVNVHLDGKEYASAPDLAIMPAGYTLLPHDHATRPHQALLPLDTQGHEDAPPLAVAIASATQYAITPAAGKLGVLVLATAWAGKGLHKATLRELTCRLNPGARLNADHYQTVMRGLIELDRLRLVLPNGLAYRVFETPVPWRSLTPAEYDLTLHFGMARGFENMLRDIKQTIGGPYKGDFLFDLSGVMQLPTKRPGLVRQYIRACALWNSCWKPGTRGEPDPQRIKDVSTERWAIMTNYLSPAAKEYLEKRGNKGRDRLYESVKSTLRDAEDLAARGLVVVHKANRESIRLLPPAEYTEAWHASRKGSAKIDG